MARVLVGVALMLCCILGCFGSGTTPNLKEIFFGRCREYQQIINPGPFKADPKNCTHLWNLFVDAFAYKENCNVTPSDYEEFAEAVAHKVDADRLLFWKRVYPFVNDYSDNTKRYTTVAGTLLGYMVDNVAWCGKLSSPGIDYTDCPYVCPGAYSAQSAYWFKTSEIFAKLATGKTQVLINGSNESPYDRNSIFAKEELVRLTPENNVTQLEILVIHNVGGPVRESCGEGSILQLDEDAKKLGLKTSCINDPPSMKHFLCVDRADSEECKFQGKDKRPMPGSASTAHVSWVTMALVGVVCSLRMF